ncbi:acyl transferase/acyl hydrolase/lysophospholipase [Aspergillus egyptiacus]|nr:acyl transferase/acyl hydrolase/lysophospholipase [Aspergillus egyptiacus]
MASHRTRIFMLSAPDEPSLTEYIQHLRAYIQQEERHISDEWLADLAYTLDESSPAHLYRAAVVSDSASKLVGSLSGPVKVHNASRKPRIGFVFTGQGAQWAGMGRELLEAYPVFRQSIERISAYMRQIGASFNVVDEILEPSESSSLNSALLRETVCTALQIALVDLLAFWGIYADAVTGHSSGEIAAAYAAGALGMEDAVTLAYYRGVLGSWLCERQSKGAMMAVGLSAAHARPYLETVRTGRAVIGCINSPSSVTVSGDSAAIEELETFLQDRKVFTRRLAVDVAYHSRHMDFIADDYSKAIAHVKPQSASSGYHQKVRFFSAVTGCQIDTAELGPNYWVRNLVEQVKFMEALQSLLLNTDNSSDQLQERTTLARKVGVDTLVEIGPHAALAGPIKQILKNDYTLTKANVSYNSVLIRNTNATSSALAVAACLATSGYPVNFQAVNDPMSHGRKVLDDLPPYA